MGDSPNDGGNVAPGMVGPAVAVEMSCRGILTQSFARERIKLRFYKTKAIAKTYFQCEKAVKQWHGPEAKAKGRKASDPSGMVGRYCGFRPPMVGFRQQMRQHQRLLKAFETACIPPGLENVS
jgi:hypothetical protein